MLEIAKKISEGLARVACSAEIDGEVVDLRYVLNEDCELTIHTFESSLEGKKAYWHTTSHIMAQAIKRINPNIKLAIGPSIDEGFYYDFDVEKHFSDEDKEKIEVEMKKIIKEDLPIERFSLPREKAIKLMKENNEPYKVELIEDLPEGEEISFYKQGEFVYYYINDTFVYNNDISDLVRAGEETGLMLYAGNTVYVKDFKIYLDTPSNRSYKKMVPQLYEIEKPDIDNREF